MFARRILLPCSKLLFSVRNLINTVLSFSFSLSFSLFFSLIMEASTLDNDTLDATINNGKV
jgi:hypothetical protein